MWIAYLLGASVVGFLMLHNNKVDGYLFGAGIALAISFFMYLFA
jgi:hypothetical protein